MLLAAAGLVLSIVLEVIHVRAYLDPSVASFCAVDARFDCDAVALSRASVLLGVPTPVWGIAGFAAMLAAAIGRSPLLFPLALIGALATSSLLVVELLQVGALCLFCEAVHVVSLILAVVAWRRRPAGGLGAGGLGEHALTLAWPLAIVLLTRFFAPPYWVLASWKSGPRLDHGVTEDGMRWIGAAEPSVVIHEYVDYGCPHCAVASSRMRMLVGRHSGSLRLVRHLYPRMRCTPPVPSRCATARAAVCAGAQGRFWEMEDWLFQHAPGHDRVDLKAGVQALGLDGAAFDACMADLGLYERLDVDVKAAHKLKIRETPAYVIDGEVMDEKAARARIDERL